MRDNCAYFGRFSGFWYGFCSILVYNNLEISAVWRAGSVFVFYVISVLSIPNSEMPQMVCGVSSNQSNGRYDRFASATHR